MQTPRTLAPDNSTLDLARCAPSSPRAWIATAGATRPAHPPSSRFDRLAVARRAAPRSRLSRSLPTRASRSVGLHRKPRGFAGSTIARPDADLRPALPPPPTRNQPHTMPKKRRANGRNKPAGARGHVRTPHRPPNRATRRTRNPARALGFSHRTRAQRDPDDAPNDPPRPGVRPARAACSGGERVARRPPSTALSPDGGRP